MDLSGAGAKAVVALLLYGPLTLEQLVGSSGVSERRIWGAIAQAERLGLVGRLKRGRVTLYTSPLLTTPMNRDSPSSSPENKSSRSSIYTYYRDDSPDKMAGQPDKMAGHHAEPPDKMAVLPPPPAKMSGQPAKMAVHPDGPPDKMAGDGEELGESSTLDQIIAADQLRAPEVSKQRASPYVLKRTAQREAITALWKELLPTKPVPPRATLDRLLLEANNSAYFLAVVIQDMAATGKDIEWPVGYITKVVKGRKERGNIPYLPATDDDDLPEMPPELANQINRVNELGAWRSDDD